MKVINIASCDTTPQMVEYLKKRVAENKLSNIIPILVNVIESGASLVGTNEYNIGYGNRSNDS